VLCLILSGLNDFSRSAEADWKIGTEAAARRRCMMSTKMKTPARIATMNKIMPAIIPGEDLMVGFDIITPPIDG